MAEDFGVPFEGYPHNYSELYLDKQKTGYIHNIRANIEHQELLYQGEHDVLSKIAGDFDVVFNLLHELYVPSIAEAFGLPNIKVATFPVLRSEYYGAPAGLPFLTENKFFNRLTWHAVVWGAKNLFSYNATVNRLRAEFDLPPINDLLSNNSRCSHMMMAAYDHLMPPCPTWTDFDYTYIGPSLPRTQVPLSDELEAFIEAGEKPIYIGFGSMRHQGAEALTNTLLEAVEQSGVRAIIAQAISSIASKLRGSENVYVLKEYPIPHHVLFPRLKAAVHHGSGITTHMAARAGIPQLVVAQASDQYLWGDMVTKRRLGPKWVDMNRLSAKKLGTAIEQLTTREEYAANARALEERVRDIDGVTNAIALFERLKDDLVPQNQLGPTKYIG
jgi:UDP:flavonoid glycosyltransferase YjiC (YdhE family)